ncbi:hypothetical protein Hamer_G028689 [Homarus americanus]|uniref:Ig-like domain-containing protein n=1 Tax=Homarus americanus TaxID=6706 RepID=A0A8J5N894_HOMAM|nr:hypothetical protein Hamer_G028689 [Homarus americanus]
MLGGEEGVEGASSWPLAAAGSVVVHEGVVTYVASRSRPLVAVVGRGGVFDLQNRVISRMRLDLWAAVALRLLLFTSLAAKSCTLRVSGVLVPPVVVSGTTVELECNYHHSLDRPDPLYSVKWYRDVNQFYEYIPKRKPPIRVFPVPHINVDESHSTREKVRLTGVTRETSGSFRCEVMGDKPFFETDDHTVNMTVVDVPLWGPEVWGVAQGDKVRPGEHLVARCQVGDSDPPAEISWTVNSEAAPTFAHLPRSLGRDQRGRPLQVSELRVTVTEEWLARGAVTLGCQVTVSSVYHKSVNVTLFDADWPQPAEFGWFSSGSSPSSPCSCRCPAATTAACWDAVTPLL